MGKQKLKFMYCRNCGSTISEHSAECENCGVKIGMGNNFCPQCGAKSNPSAQSCKKCGAIINKQIDKCTTCKHRTFSRFGRLLCGLTNKRPEFAGEPCPNYTSDCPVCKDGILNTTCGVVCASTNEKYTCNESCPKYNVWREETNLRNNRLRDAAKEKRITGWLLAFVILTALDVVGNIYLPFHNASHPLLASLQILFALPYLIAGIACITALYMRASNAVSLAITYCIMGILSCISYIGTILYLSLQHPDQAQLSSAIPEILSYSASFILWIIWIVYFLMSYKVDVVLPREKRRWSWFEIILLALWTLRIIAGTVIFVIGVNSVIAMKNVIQ